MRLQKNIILNNLNTSGVGGKAEYFYNATSSEKMTEAINYAKQKKLNFLILGAGSNVLISDDGFPGLVIKNSIKGIVGFKEIIKVGSGTLLSETISTTVNQHLSGLEKLAGIPGTIGGAAYGNSGAYGVSLGDNISKVVAFDPAKNKIVSLTRKQCQFGYRDSIFKKNGFVILEVHLKLKKITGNSAINEVRDILKTRATKNFWQGKSPGSFFKNIPVEKIPESSLKLIPEDKIIHGKVTAGYLLESVGAKGKKVGNVQVSDTHANLIINTGKGKAADFIKLASELVKMVKEKYGIILEPEVQLINLPKLIS